MRFTHTLTAIVAVLVAVALTGCGSAPATAKLTAQAGKPRQIDAVAAQVEKDAQGVQKSSNAISEATQGIREDVKADPAVESAATPKLNIIDAAVMAIQAIAQHQQSQTVADLSRAANDLRKTIAERDAAIGEAKKQSDRAGTAEGRALAAEKRANDAFKNGLIGIATIGVLGGVGLLGLAGWLAFSGKGREAIFVGLVAGLLFGAAALLVWFAEHWKEIAVVSGVVVAIAVGYFAWVRFRLFQSEQAIGAIVPAVDQFDPKGSSIKPLIEHYALNMGVKSAVKSTVSRAKRGVVSIASNFTAQPAPV